MDMQPPVGRQQPNGQQGQHTNAPWGQQPNAQGSQPPLRHGAPQPPKKKRGVPWGKIIGFGFLGLVLLLIGAIFFAKHSFESSVRHAGADVTLESQFNVWISDGYENGVGAAWEVPGEVIGTSADREHVLVSQLIEPNKAGVGNTITTIHDVATGQIVNEFEGQYDCHQSMPAIEGKVYCTQTPGPGVDPDGNEGTVEPLGALDIATGEFVPFYNAPFIVTGLSVIGVKDGTIYAGTQSEMGDYFIAFNGDGTIAWQTDTISFLDASRCRIAGEVIGCELFDKVLVLDRADGSVLLDLPVAGSGKVVWSDEAVATGQFFAETTELHYFDGRQETTEVYTNSVGIRGPVGVPEPVLTHEDMLREELVDDVGIDGKAYADTQPSSFLTESGIVLLESGAFIEGSMAESVMVSEHGRAFVIGELGSGNAKLVNPTGDELGTLPKDTGVVDGLLLEGHGAYGGVVKVLPPSK